MNTSHNAKLRLSLHPARPSPRLGSRAKSRPELLV
jgi:hypothetical protein